MNLFLDFITVVPRYVEAVFLLCLIGLSKRLDLVGPGRNVHEACFFELGVDRIALQALYKFPIIDLPQLFNALRFTGEMIVRVVFTVGQCSRYHAPITPRRAVADEGGFEQNNIQVGHALPGL